MDIYESHGIIYLIVLKEWWKRNDLFTSYIDHTTVYEKLFSFTLFFLSHLMLVPLIRNLYICKLA